jgi:hypothetical protein
LVEDEGERKEAGRSWRGRRIVVDLGEEGYRRSGGFQSVRRHTIGSYLFGEEEELACGTRESERERSDAQTPCFSWT